MLVLNARQQDKYMKDIRQEYHAEGLDESQLLADPVAQARLWVQQAIEAELPVANAMSLATVNAAGQPSCRTVLLKDVEDGGFVFFTHYDSRKGRDIADNPQVALTFFWPAFDRQIQILGRAEAVSRQLSEDYFHSRPYGSQVSAAISPQSQPVTEGWLEQQVAQCQQQYPQRPVPLPERWGGYRVIPSEIEFWHGRPSRLHDRIRFIRQGNHWQTCRLAP